jgi:hypothetical protein
VVEEGATMVRRFPLAAVLAALVCAASACAAGGEQVAGEGDVDPGTIESMFVVGVIDGMVVDTPDAGAPVDGSGPAIEVRVDRHLLNVGDIYFVDGSGPFREELPQEATTVRLRAPSWIAEAVEPGTNYAFAVDRSFTLGDPSEEPWRIKYAFDSKGALVAGQQEVMRFMAAETNVLRLGTETQLDATLAFLRERRATLNARNQGLDAPLSPRQALLEANREADAARQIAADVAEWSRLPDTDRQLPPDVSTEPVLAEQERVALGIPVWHPWTLVVLYDETSAARGGWAGIQLEGYGYIGPTLLDTSQTIAIAAGFGPGTASVHLIEWPEGEPITRHDGPGTATPSHRIEHRIDSAAIAGSEDAGSAVLVDLRHGRVAMSVISQKTLLDLLGQNAVPPTDGPER